ncbi:MAG: T9SS type A sorting domain-containing protein, partial [Flavobacterium sp.]
GLSNYRQAVFATPAVWCNGVTITDTGGTAGDYTDNQYYVRTLIPSQPQKKIRLTFSAFNLEEDYDFLTIYDGPNVDAPEYGSYTGTFISSPIESSSPDGALTVKFFSDQGITASGYVATVSCLQNLGVDNFATDIDFTYSPNPTTGSVSILSNTEMKDIAVYNVQGQLLYRSKNNGLDKFVDLSAFASGTYFFKLNFATDKQVNFKVVKN